MSDEGGLTAKEREALTQHFAWGYVPDAVLTEFERIIAAHVAEDRAERDELLECYEELTLAGRLDRAHAEAAEARLATERVGGIRWAVYEGGLWCGECDPTDPDDGCCVVAPRLRAALSATSTEEAHGA